MEAIFGHMMPMDKAINFNIFSRSSRFSCHGDSSHAGSLHIILDNNSLNHCAKFKESRMKAYGGKSCALGFLNDAKRQMAKMAIFHKKMQNTRIFNKITYVTLINILFM